jgi:hypothetical protein
LRGEPYPRLHVWDLHAITCLHIRGRQRKFAHRHTEKKTDRRGVGDTKKEKEIEVICPQIKESLKPLKAGGGKNQALPRASHMN